MEKLIELLNEYEPYIQSDGTHTDNFWWYVSQGHSAVFPKEVGVERIISKQYGFIKWLVGNDKINWWRIENNQDYAEYLGSSLPIEEYSVEILLMLLAIADDPINYLCCIIRQF